MSIAAGPKADNPKLAVALILFTVLVLAVGDALVKALSGSLVLWQIFVLRSALAVVALLAVWRRGFPSLCLRPQFPGWTILRSTLLVAMWIAYYVSLPHLQFAVAAAAFYTLPIFITLFAAAFAGERVTRRGWCAVALGFGGVVLILRPSAGGFNAYALLPLLSAVLYALAMVLTRTKCRNEHPLILSGSLNLAFIVTGLVATLALGLIDIAPSPFLAAAWAPLGGREVLAIVLLATVFLLASVGAAAAYQIGRASLVASFDIAYVAFAALCGLVFFGEVPAPSALGGMLMIVVAGAMALRQS